MEFRDQVLDLLAEVAENDIVKENPDVEDILLDKEKSYTMY